LIAADGNVPFYFLTIFAVGVTACKLSPADTGRLLPA